MTLPYALHRIPSFATHMVYSTYDTVMCSTHDSLYIKPYSCVLLAVHETLHAACGHAPHRAMTTLYAGVPPLYTSRC
jgi:hypothetical protein